MNGRPVDLHTIAVSSQDLDTLFECVRFTSRACTSTPGESPEVVEDLKGLERLLMRAEKGGTP